MISIIMTSYSTSCCSFDNSLAVAAVELCEKWASCSVEGTDQFTGQDIDIMSSSQVQQFLNQMLNKVCLLSVLTSISSASSYSSFYFSSLPSLHWVLKCWSKWMPFTKWMRKLIQKFDFGNQVHCSNPHITSYVGGWDYVWGGSGKRCFLWWLTFY